MNKKRDRFFIAHLRANTYIEEGLYCSYREAFKTGLKEQDRLDAKMNEPMDLAPEFYN